MAVRSPQIHDLVELYAMSTGQRTAGFAATARPVSLVQSSGSIYQARAYSNESVLLSVGGQQVMGRLTVQNTGDPGPSS